MECHDHTGDNLPPKYTEVDIADPPRPESEVSGMPRSPKPVECGARYSELLQIAMTFVTVGFSTLIPHAGSRGRTRRVCVSAISPPRVAKSPPYRDKSHRPFLRPLVT